MQPIPPLETFGRRICICGPSNSGKSTLARFLGRKLGAPPVYLDQFRHLPNTDWQVRPDDDFKRLHDAAVLGEAWVMDGNYTKLMPFRMERATGIILLSDNRWANLVRYFKRTLFQKHRAGNLEGAKDSVKWLMIHWIMVRAPQNLRRYGQTLPKTSLPYIHVRSMRELNQLYAAWDLSRTTE